MNYNKKRMIVALHLTVSSVMLLSGFTSPGTKMNTAGDLRYAGGEIAVQIGDSVVDGTKAFKRQETYGKQRLSVLKK